MKDITEVLELQVSAPDKLQIGEVVTVRLDLTPKGKITSGCVRGRSECGRWGMTETKSKFVKTATRMFCGKMTAYYKGKLNAQGIMEIDYAAPVHDQSW